MSYLPRVRRERRTVLLLIVVTSVLLTSLLVFRTSCSHDDIDPIYVPDGDVAAAKQLPIVRLSQSGDGGGGVAFNSEELRYIRFGEGDATVPEDDPRYLDYIRSFVSRPARHLTRNLKDKSGRKHFSQAGQSAYVDKRLGQRRDGFFIECGAVDGETLSNSLFFELERNWTGLLVEANPEYHRTLLAKNRQTYVLSGCLSPTGQPRSVTFRPAGVFGGIGDSMEKTHADFVERRHGGKTVVTVQCFPLPHVLRALSVTRVDYLSLDVEGPELEILRTVDWNRVRVDILTIEYRVITAVPRVKVDVEATAKKLDDLRRFFNDTGLYREVATLNTLDVVFERTDLSRRQD
jgi:FkbM family methyltransferase